MATIGTQITSPEAGTIRIDDTNTAFIYSSGVTRRPSGLTSAYNKSDSYFLPNEYITFKFKSRLLRVYGVSYSSMTSSVTLTVDNINYTMNPSVYFGSTATWQVLHFDIHNLDESVHTATITNTGSTNNNYYFDCIDLDKDGYIISANDGKLHPYLNEVNDIKDMQIGDCIRCRYTSQVLNKPGFFSELGNTAKPLLSTTTGTAIQIPDGSFYFIKVAKGLLIADRVVQNQIEWLELTKRNYIFGSTYMEYLIPYVTSFTSTYANITYSNFYSSSSAIYVFQRGYTTNSWYVSDLGTKTLTLGDITIQNAHWIKMDLNNGNIITGATHFKVKSQSVSGDKHAVKAFDLYISEDGVTYTKIISIDNYPNNSNEQYYEIDSSLKIVSFVFSIRQGWYNSTWQYVGASEINFVNIKPNWTIRSLSGGCAYRDTNGFKTLTQVNNLAWPINNEWDMYIYGSSLNGKIQIADSNIWNYMYFQSWCKDTTLVGKWLDSSGTNMTTSEGHRMLRGLRYSKYGEDWPHVSWGTNDREIFKGFRPVLEYDE